MADTNLCLLSSGATVDWITRSCTGASPSMTGDSYINDGNDASGFSASTGSRNGGWSINQKIDINFRGTSNLSEIKIRHRFWGIGYYNASYSIYFRLYYNSQWNVIHSQSASGLDSFDTSTVWVEYSNGWSNVTAIQVEYNGGGSGNVPFLSAWGNLSIYEVQAYGSVYFKPKIILV